jgi:hypothetical protein
MPRPFLRGNFRRGCVPHIMQPLLASVVSVTDQRRYLMASVEDVARWMQSEIERTGDLHQIDAVYEIESRFGTEFVYENERGNLAIDRKVLRAFRKLTEDTVVWMRMERCWVKRGEHDPPGRQAY